MIPTLETQLNEFLNLLVDDGCFDHASKLVDILEAHDLLAEDTDDREDGSENHNGWAD